MPEFYIISLVAFVVGWVVAPLLNEIVRMIFRRWDQHRWERYHRRQSR